MPRIGSSIETESRLKFSRGSDSLTGVGFSIEMMNCFGGRWRLWSHNILNVQSVTELYVLEWLILCDVLPHSHKRMKPTIFAVCPIGERQTHSASCLLFGLGLLSWSAIWSGCRMVLLTLSNAPFQDLPMT